MLDAVFLRMLPYGRNTLGLCIFCLYLHGHTFTLISDQEIQFQAGVLLKIVQTLSFLDECIGHQILVDGALVAAQVAQQDIRPSVGTQHCDQNADIGSIDLENVVYRISLQWQAGDVGVVATAGDIGIFQPLQRVFVKNAAAALLHFGPLVLLVVLGQLLGDGVEAGPDMRFILVIGIFHHIGAVFFEDGMPDSIYSIHIASFQQGVHGSGQSAYGHITVEQRLHSYVDAFRNWSFLFEALA